MTHTNIKCTSISEKPIPALERASVADLARRDDRVDAGASLTPIAFKANTAVLPMSAPGAAATGKDAACF